MRPAKFILLLIAGLGGAAGCSGFLPTPPAPTAKTATATSVLVQTATVDNPPSPGSATPLPAATAPPKPLLETFEPDPRVAEAIAQVDARQLYTSVGSLSGEWPVLIGGEPYSLTSRVHLAGEPIDKAMQFVYEQLQASGLTVNYFDWAYEWGSVRKGRNVIGVITGTVRPDEVVLLTAHVDDMLNRDVDAEGAEHRPPPIPVNRPLWLDSPAPGADDNASGVAGVLMAAQILSHYRFERTVRVVLFSGEENGYLGSYAYASAMAKAGENIVAVYNLDMIGYDHSGGPVVEIYLRPPDISAADLALANVFTKVVETYQLELLPALRYQAGGKYAGSDHGMFWGEGYPAVFIHEDGENDSNPFYHSQYERLAHLNLAYLTNVVKAAIGAVAQVAQPVGQAPDP